MLGRGCWTVSSFTSIGRGRSVEGEKEGDLLASVDSCKLGSVKRGLERKVCLLTAMFR